MFRKRIFTFGTLAESLLGLVAGLPDSISARKRGSISHAFAEKIRLAATSVNGCVYCSYGHSMLAMRAGISKEEIKTLLGGEIGCSADPNEAPALFFAQHYAERSGRPDTLMLEQLKDAYGEVLASDIITFIREIQFGNLSGNTFEAFLSRLKGDAAPESSWLFEACFFLVSLPILGPLHLAMKIKGSAG